MKTKIPMSELVKDPNWQKVRKSLVGQWSKRPQWCCEQLRKYLGNINKTDDKKLAIVFNYLTGTGFRLGKIKHECVQEIRTQVSMEIKKRKSKKEWTL